VASIHVLRVRLAAALPPRRAAVTATAAGEEATGAVEMRGLPPLLVRLVGGHRRVRLAVLAVEVLAVAGGVVPSGGVLSGARVFRRPDRQRGARLWLPLRSASSESPHGLRCRKPAPTLRQQTPQQVWPLLSDAVRGMRLAAQHQLVAARRACREGDVR